MNYMDIDVNLDKTASVAFKYQEDNLYLLPNGRKYHFNIKSRCV